MTYELPIEVRKELTMEVERGLQKDLITLEANLRYYTEIALPRAKSKVEELEKEIETIKDNADLVKGKKDAIKMERAQIEAYENKIVENKDTIENTKDFLSMFNK